MDFTHRHTLVLSKLKHFRLDAFREGQCFNQHCITAVDVALGGTGECIFDQQLRLVLRELEVFADLGVKVLIRLQNVMIEQWFDERVTRARGAVRQLLRAANRVVRIANAIAGGVEAGEDVESVQREEASVIQLVGKEL